MPKAELEVRRRNRLGNSEKYRGAKFRRLKLSMLQSLERGRRTEIDSMNGYVVERGREKGVPTPVNGALTTLVREIEASARPISPDNLESLLRCET